jgi:hypothetical protein
MDRAARFWAKVDRGPDCWLWRGARATNGYGQVRVDYRLWLAHRYALVLDGRTAPDHMMVCHSCDTPLCVRPHHLFIGTAKDNAVDMSLKGRGTGKLSGEEVLTIRAERMAGVRQADLAKRFGVSSQTIGAVCAVQTYAAFYEMPEF